MKIMLSKGMVLTVIVLFVGAGVIPSITGHNENVEKNDYILNEKDTLNMKNDDYNNLIEQVIENGIISNKDWLEQDKLLASDGVDGDFFGQSVSIYEDVALVGSPNSDENGEMAGAAYIFTRSGDNWVEQAKLLPSDGTEGDLFGCSVSIDEDYALIGAHLNDDYGLASGSAYVFMRSGEVWAEQAKLLASDGAIGDWFGWSVSIDGDCALIGAIHDDTSKGIDSGSAYLFKRSSEIWSEQIKIIASDGDNGDIFGQSVSIDEDYALIGAHLNDDYGLASGSAYVFMRSGEVWAEQAKLLASDGAFGDRFGWSVSIDGDYALIGSPFNEENGRLAGSAYIFTRLSDIWTEQAKLLPADAEEYDEFGQSVSINKDNALVGVYLDDDHGFASGSAYLFTRSGTEWIENTKFLPSDGIDGDWFGLSVSIDSNSVLIGAPGSDDNGVDSGSAYVYEKSISSDLDCSGNLIWIDIQPGETVFGMITIENIGEPLSQLDWEITEYPEWGTDWFYTINAGDDTDLTPEDGEVTVGISVTTPDEKNSNYSGYIIVENKDDPSDTCEIQVSLTVQKTKEINPFLNFLEQHPHMFPMLRQLLGLQ